MSTCLHLRCIEHDPPIDSGDVGYNLTHLPRIRREVANRQELLALLARVEDSNITFDDAHTNTTLQFLRWHPNCRLELWDEYGNQHWLTEDEVVPQ